VGLSRGDTRMAKGAGGCIGSPVGVQLFGIDTEHRGCAVTITPRQFVDTWARSELREQQAAQSHFNMLCQLVGHPTPVELDPDGTVFTFEENVSKATGGHGRADVWYKGHFAWEYKGKHKDLDAAYAQLLAYKGGLDNPPLLVVCDFLEYRIYPQWPNTSGLPFKFHNEDLLQRDTQRYITWLLEAPDSFRELRQSELEKREQLTRELAEQFANLADLMRRHKGVDGKPRWEPMRIARFLTKLTFALFAEDVELMPRPFDQPVFRFLVEGAGTAPEEFAPQLETLFKAMDGQARTFMMKPVPYFNGGLFADTGSGAADGTEALDLTEIPGAISLLGKVSEADWRRVNPTIFGTLFEGALDESKRAQLGAHYTSEADIRLVVEPVLMQPLYRLWTEIQAEAEPLMQVFLKAETPRSTQQARDRLITLQDRMMNTLGSTRILDPACGSGNFLYVSLRAMKDLEGRVRKFFEPLGLPFRDVVTPRQLYGIERDEFASRLAQVVVWIGYLQWRYEDEGRLHPLLKATSNPHPRQLPSPILQDKTSPDEPDHIQCVDAIMQFDAQGRPFEPEWPEADVITGNPPFLGGNRIRQELGHDYVDSLFILYNGRVPAFADLVCYWFEKARASIGDGRAKRAGLLATNSIRGGANRTVLERIKQSGDIFVAWSDRPWVLEGAAVRISIVGFDDGREQIRVLDEQPVEAINADLTSRTDAAAAKPLPENEAIFFRSDEKGGPFDIDAETALAMMVSPNSSGRPNSDVVRPYVNGLDVTRRPRNMWIIDFGVEASEQDAAKYEEPFDYVRRVVKPKRDEVRNVREQNFWWLHRRPAPDMREAVAQLTRFVATPTVAKHRLFVWLKGETIPDHQLYVFARDDNYFFGVLHAYPHEIWSLRLGTWLGKGNDPRYTPTTTFETYPFPWPPGSEPNDHPAYCAISEAARQLNEEREAWLNPPDLRVMDAKEGGKHLRERTLTNLYNAVEAYRASENGPRNGGDAAAAFAPRLVELHDTLDRAVLDAYGWSDLAESLRTPEGDEELLRRLLALNLERAAQADQT
jgi:hypothetical protein